MTSRPSSPALSPAAKFGLLGALYFSQGLPYGFFTQALPVLLRKSGFSLGQIGLTSMLALPWAMKFLWAPAVDRYAFKSLGRRRSWILPLQAAAVITLSVLAATGALAHLNLLLGAVFLINLLSATQDIATDGFAVDMLSYRERGLANGLQVAGYRFGMIVGGGLLLILFGSLGGSNTFMAMAGLIALASVPVLLITEPPAGDQPGAPEPRRPEVSLMRPLAQFLRRPGVSGILLLITAYKFGDAGATAMLRPFLVDAGLGLSKIGWLLGTVGFIAGLLGALAGGALVNRIGRKQSLLLFGALQAVTVGGYALLATGTPGNVLLHAVCGAEHFIGGMATAALFTCMMDWSSSDNAATDYTVQASAVVVSTGLASTLSGFSAQALGYSGHFTLSSILSALSLLVVLRCFPGKPEVSGSECPEKEENPCA